jgi:hypothetical protein
VGNRAGRLFARVWFWGAAGFGKAVRGKRAGHTENYSPTHGTKSERMLFILAIELCI